MQTNRSTGSEQAELFAVEKASEYIQSVTQLAPEDVERLKREKPKSLGIRCRRSDCKRDLHCFDPSGSKLKFTKGSCRVCGVDLIDWDIVHIRDIPNVEEKFNYFKKEWIRHFFFHVPITARIEKYARRLGLAGLAQKFEDQLNKDKMLRYMPALDWNQTKMLDGTIVHWARHATASCCRACMNYWHNIPFDHQLTTEDVKYLEELAMRYVRLRIPDLETPQDNRLAKARTQSAA